jgi:SAM-dependent methyltransferase
VGQLEFSQSIVEQLERVYRGRDVRRRRALVHEALGATAGDRVLDVGCGPGFFVSELLDAVGPDGSVVGVDLSPDMLAVATKRAQGRPNAEFIESAAAPLPLPDQDFDRALSVQVMEYVDDVAAALGELHRVLRPRGRVVVWDVDWSTLSWHSTDAVRMARMVEAWDSHLTHPALPRTLAAQLRDAGFSDVRMEAHVFTTNELDPGDLRRLSGDADPQLRGEQGLLSADEAQAWADEQYALADDGRFFFSVTQFCFVASA